MLAVATKCVSYHAAKRSQKTAPMSLIKVGHRQIEESRTLIERGPAENQVATFAYRFGNTTKSQPSKQKQKLRMLDTCAPLLQKINGVINM
jgi:hypothetical protein